MYLQQVNFHKVIIYIDSRNIFSLSRNIKSCTWRVLCWRAQPGFEPGTSRTRSANHTPRPLSQAEETAAFLSRNFPCILNFGKLCFCSFSLTFLPQIDHSLCDMFEWCKVSGFGNFDKKSSDPAQDRTGDLLRVKQM